MKSFVAVILALVLVSAGFLFWLRPTGSIPSGLSASTTLYGRILAPAGWGFGSGNVTQPGPLLKAYVTASLTLSLHSGDSIAHTWFLDYNGNGVKDADEPGSGSFSSSLTFTTTLWRVGSFKYACAIHGLAMSGPISIIPLDLAVFPLPFTYAQTMNTSMVMGYSIAHNGVGAANTIDVVGGTVLAARLGRSAPAGTLLARLDIEAATGTAPSITLTQKGNIITLGGRGVNTVSNYVNPLLSVRQALATDGSGKGIYVVDDGKNYVLCTPTTPCPVAGETDHYALVSIYYDAANNRYILEIAGLSGFATRITTTLVGLGALPLSGTGIVVKLVDTTSDGTFDTYQVVDGSGGAVTMPSPLPIPPF